MRKFYFLLLLVPILVSCGTTANHTTSVDTYEIRYKHQDIEMVGFVAKPKLTDTTSTRPAVLVVHEWWGQNEYPRKRALQLAEMGYVAMAVDMYGMRKLADHPKQAGEFAGAVFADSKKLRGRFEEALKTLQTQPSVDKNKIVAIGYCFGGSVVLEAARQGLPLKGVASFHGGLMTPSQAVKGKSPPIRVYNGAADPMVTPEDIKKFEAEMKKAQVDYSIVNYPNVKHGFTNPEATENGAKYNLPLAYNQEADKDSWHKLQEFLGRVLK